MSAKVHHLGRRGDSSQTKDFQETEPETKKKGLIGLLNHGVQMQACDSHVAHQFFSLPSCVLSISFA
jgi:hypothetical protein